MKKIILSLALFSVVNVITANPPLKPRCAKAGQGETNNGVCYNVYDEAGNVIGSNCTNPGAGSSAVRDCIYGTE